MLTVREVELALIELNRKWSSIQTYYMAKEDLDEYEAADKATSLIQNDIEKLENESGQRLYWDNNYSHTWGFGAYGLYNSLEEMNRVSQLLDAGW